MKSVFNILTAAAILMGTTSAFASSFEMEKYKVVEGKQSYIMRYSMTKDSMPLFDRLKLGIREAEICGAQDFDIMSDGTAAPGILAFQSNSEKVVYQYSFVVDCK